MYANKAEMILEYGEKELIELTDRAEILTGAIVDEVLDQALTGASAVIDSYVSRRYKLPLTTTPIVLRDHCMSIAWYKLHRGRHREEDRKAYEDAMAYLGQLSSGAAVLDVGGSEPQSAPAQAVKDGPERTFSRTKKDW